MLWLTHREKMPNDSFTCLERSPTMLGRFLFGGAGVLALLCVTAIPGPLQAQHARGGSRAMRSPAMGSPAMRSPNFGRPMGGFDRRVFTPGFGRSMGGFDRRIFTPGFGGFTPGFFGSLGLGGFSPGLGVF